MRRVCEECGGQIVKKEVDYKLYDVSLGRFRADVCRKCGEVCYEEDVSEEMTKRAKELGLWGLEARTTVGQVGDALDVRLSKRLVEFLNVKKGQEVRVQPVDKKKVEIIIV